jgi:hypothetical protein
MRIKVLVDSINKETYNCILNYYNSNKLDIEEPLERLDRTEGGFKINIKNMKDKICDANNKIKQLRWNKGYLDSKYYIGFNEKETMLLYESLVFGLKGNVILEE